jgi:uncharacterized delta-60 repeat protein
MVVVRLTPNGPLDTGFNGIGMVMTDVDTGHDDAFALAIQGDDRIVVGGYADTVQGRNFAVLRYNGDGSLDSSFGIGGKVTTAPGSSQINTLKIQGNGKILAGGYQASGNYWMVALVRYNADGSLDASFDNDGIVTTPAGTWRSEAGGLIILPGGQIVVAGYSGTLAEQTDFLLVRYNADGSLDASFGAGGLALTDIAGAADAAHALAVQADGKIVVAGEAFFGNAAGIALARYLME